MKHLLTIAVPTFNRVELLQEQLNFLRNETAGRADVRVLVSNNGSTDGTAGYLASLAALQIPGWEFVHQESNLGLVGNIRYCVENSKAKFVWLVSDDDRLKPGIVERVLTVIAQKRFGLLHLNWGVISRERKPLADSFYGFSVMQHSDEGHQAFVQITQAEHLGMSFISANIMDSSLAQQALGMWRGHRSSLALPLFLSAYCSHKGGFFFEKKTWVYGRTGAVSWADSAEHFAFHDFPIAYQNLRCCGFSRKQILSKHLRLLVLTPRVFSYCLRNPLQGAVAWLFLPFRLLFPRKP